MRHAAPQGKRWIVFLGLAALAIGVLATAVWAASGQYSHLRFRVVAVDPVVELQKPVMKVGDLTVTREEFLFYLNEFLAYPVQGDLLQRNFLWHYSFVERLARTYPIEIEDVLVRTLINNDRITPECESVLRQWVLGQADLYARILLMDQNAREDGAATKRVTETFYDHLLAQELLDVVQRGEMEPTREGLVKFVTDLPGDKRANLDSVLRDPKDIKPFEEDDIDKRLGEYQADLASAFSIERPYEKFEDVNRLKSSPETVLATVGNTAITFADFMAVHGNPKNNADWNNIKGTRVGQLIAATALSAEARALRLENGRLSNRVTLGWTFYHAMHEAVARYAPAAGGVDFNLTEFLKLSQRGRFEEFQGWFLAQTAQLNGYDRLWVDKDFLKSVRWSLLPLEKSQAQSLIMPARTIRPVGARSIRPDEVRD